MSLEKILKLSKNGIVDLTSTQLVQRDLPLILNELNRTNNIYFINWGPKNLTTLNANKEIKLQIQTKLAENFLNIKESLIIEDHIDTFDVDEDFLKCLSDQIIKQISKSHTKDGENINKKLISEAHAQLFINVGLLYAQKLNNYTEALVYYQKAVDIQKRILPFNHPLIAETLSKMGVAYRHKGEYGEALTYHQKALEIKKLSLPPTHPSIALSLNCLGNVFVILGEFDEALKYYKETLEIRRQNKSSSLPTNRQLDIWKILNNIGSVNSILNKFDESIRYYKEALSVRRDHLIASAPHPDIGMILNGLGSVYKKVGMYDEALKCYEEALLIFERTLPSHHLDIADTLCAIGIVFKNRGEFDSALECLSKALAIYKIVRQSDLNHNDIVRVNRLIKEVNDCLKSGVVKGRYRTSMQIWL